MCGHDSRPAARRLSSSTCRVATPHDEQRGRAHFGEARRGEIGATASRDDSPDVRLVGRGAQGCGGTGAGTEVADAETGELRLPVHPMGDEAQPPGQQLDVEHVRAINRLGRREQIEQQGAEARRVEQLGDQAVAGTVTAAATAVSEDDHPRRPVGDGEVAGQPRATGVDLELVVAVQGARVVAGTIVVRAHEAGGRGFEQHDDLVVGGRGELRVPLPDGVERRGGRERDDFVGDGRELRHALPGGHGDREDQATRTMCAGDLQRRPCGATGCDAVVDHDHGSPGERDHGPTTAIQLGASFHLEPLAGFHRGEGGRGDTRLAHDVVVDDANAVFADGAHSQLGVDGNAELAHDDHVERRAEGPCDLERDGHAAPGQADDDRMLIPQGAESRPELLPGLPAISEPSHDHLLDERPGHARWIGTFVACACSRSTGIRTSRMPSL